MNHSNIICDLDGTIALDHKRNHHLHKESCPKRADHPRKLLACECGPYDRKWDEYFAACTTDTPNDAVIKVLIKFAIYHNIYILSGRSMGVSEQTIAWLQKHNVPYNYLQMRGVQDRTDDHLLKLQWAEDFDLWPGNTLFVMEDRKRVVDAWRAKGFTCFQVAAGDF